VCGWVCVGSGVGVGGCVYVASAVPQAAAGGANTQQRCGQILACVANVLLMCC